MSKFIIARIQHFPGNNSIEVRTVYSSAEWSKAEALEAEHERASLMGVKAYELRVIETYEKLEAGTNKSDEWPDA